MNAWWIVLISLLPIIVVPVCDFFVKLKGAKTVQEKRKLTNMAGLSILGLIVLVVVSFSVTKWFQEQEKHKQEIVDTKVSLKKLCQSFLNDDRDVIMSWAKGDLKDV